MIIPVSWGRSFYKNGSSGRHRERYSWKLTCGGKFSLAQILIQVSCLCGVSELVTSDFGNIQGNLLGKIQGNFW